MRKDLIPFARPVSVDQAVQLMSEQPWSVLAGGTDLYPAHVGKPLAAPVLDISNLSDLRCIDREGEGWRIGGLVTWTDLIKADLPPAFYGLKSAAREIGSIQIQNVGTIGGNLCNASPAADGVPPLMTLDASVELSSLAGKRQLPIDEFLTGYRATAKRDDELVTAILIADESAAGASSFQKLGARKYLVISILMVAAHLEASAGLVTKARVAVGACSPVAVRLHDLERALIGKRLTSVAKLVLPRHLENLNPIDDVRASAGYRQEAALELVQRSLAEAASQL